MLKKYLGGFFWAPIPHKRYQNSSGFAGACYLEMPFRGVFRIITISQKISSGECLTWLYIHPSPLSEYFSVF